MSINRSIDMHDVGENAIFNTLYVCLQNVTFKASTLKKQKIHTGGYDTLVQVSQNVRNNQSILETTNLIKRI